MDINFEVSRYTQDKHPDSHMHEQYEIFISLSDEGTFFVREEGYPLRFGMVFILAPFEIHRCFCNGNKKYDRYVVHFSEEYLKLLSTPNTDIITLFNSAPIVQQLENDTLFEIMARLTALDKSIETGFGGDCQKKLELLNFLLMIARITNASTFINSPAIKMESRAGEILRYIHANYNQDISLEQLSKEFFISKSRLSEVFKQSTGFSVGNYVIAYRIKIACTLLQSGMNVQDVGYMVGFHTNTHFIRTFKNKTGYSPSNFVKRRSNAVSGTFCLN